MLPMFFLSTIFAIDQALGRLDYESLSDQTLMEMLISGMGNDLKGYIQDESGNYKDVDEWEVGEGCSPGLIDGRVVYVDFSTYESDDKQFPFEYIPPLVESFVMRECNLHGTLNTSLLPPNLEKLNIFSNYLHGTIKFKSFPRKLQSIQISDNKFDGSCALSDLPDSIKTFKAYLNEFSGEIAMDSLPAKMEKLDLSTNKLEGALAIKILPACIRHIDLSSNAFTGDFQLLSLPPSLEIIYITNNNLSETIVLLKSTREKWFDFYCHDIKSVIDENGRGHAWEGDIMKDLSSESSSDESSESSADDE